MQFFHYAIYFFFHTGKYFLRRKYLHDKERGTHIITITVGKGKNLMQQKIIGATLCLALVVWGCGAGKSISLSLFIDSNQVFIESTVGQIDIGKSIRGTIPAGSKVVLQSMEAQTTLDKPIIAIIEDQLIQSLVAEKFVPLERDENLISLLIEEGHNDKYSLAQKKYFDPDSAQRNLFSLFKTKINAAAYIVSYRVLECGLIYRELAVSGKIGREGIAKLHIRIQNTKTGEIVYANNLLGEKKDQVPKELVDPLARFHYTFYTNEYPLQK